MPQTWNKKNLENCVTIDIIGGIRREFHKCAYSAHAHTHTQTQTYTFRVCDTLWIYVLNIYVLNQASNGFCGLWSNVNNMASAVTIIIDQQKKVNKKIITTSSEYLMLDEANYAVLWCENTNNLFRSISNVHFTHRVTEISKRNSNLENMLNNSKLIRVKN